MTTHPTGGASGAPDTRRPELDTEPPCWCGTPVLAERYRCPLHDLYGIRSTRLADTLADTTTNTG